MMQASIKLFLSAFLALLVTGCDSSQPSSVTPQLTPDYVIQIEHGETERVPAETSNPVLDNCNGSGNIVQTIRRGRTTTVVIDLTYSATVEVGLDGVIKTQLGTEFSVQEGETISSSNDISVTIASGTRVSYQVQWFETWDTGTVNVQSNTQSLNLQVPYRIRRGYDADISSQSEPCAGMSSTIVPITPALPPSDTPSPTPTRIPPTATSTATPDPIEVALTGVSSNSEWTVYAPYEREFDGVMMVLVPAGCFDMGTSEAESRQYMDSSVFVYIGNQTPQHEFCFEQPFWVDRYEVSNAQFVRMGGQAATAAFSGDTTPRTNVTWPQARDFCFNRGARLLTEAEWEYVARGPDNLVYPWGNEFIAENVIYKDTPEFGNRRPAPVGSRPNGSSWVGALDMSGNVYEWVSSIMADYPYDPHDGREADSQEPVTRELRGGAWTSDKFWVRAATRNAGWSDNTPVVDRGFRCARSYDE